MDRYLPIADQYTADEHEPNEITASPLRATTNDPAGFRRRS